MLWVLLGVIAVLLVVVGLLVVRQQMLARQQRSQQLKEDFGPEYQRAVAEHGDERSAEKELTDRRRRVEKLDIRPLDPGSRERYIEQWGATQRYFVDEPAAAVGQAHTLVQEVMRERGYPVEDDFERRAADISVDHPRVVENYRSAHEISLKASNGQASTEELRRSMVHFRALFEDLLKSGEDHRTDDARPASEGERAHQGVEQSTIPDQTSRRG